MIVNDELILCTTDDGVTIIQFRAVDGTILLTQTKVVELFDTAKFRAKHRQTIKLVDRGKVLDDFLVNNEFRVFLNAEGFKADDTKHLVVQQYMFFCQKRKKNEGLLDSEQYYIEELEKITDVENNIKTKSNKGK